MNGRDEHSNFGAVEHNTLLLDKLLNAALKSSEWITDFMNETEPTSEDFLLDRIQFEKETMRLDGFDKQFGRMMDGRAIEDEGPCFAGMRTALGGLVMLLKENVFDCIDRHVPAMEDLDQDFRVWIGRRRDLAERMEEEDVFQTLEEIDCCLGSMPLSYTLDETWPEGEDDISETTMSSNSDNDYFTPLQSRVSSFATDYSENDGKPTRQTFIMDFTAIVERFSHYNDILFESLSVIETTLDWATTTSSHSTFPSSSSQNNTPSSHPLTCNNILCNETFSNPTLWSAHTAICPNPGTRLTLHGTPLTHKCTFSSCSAHFPSISALLSHELSHHAIHLCTIPTCNTAFYSPSIASEHALEVHGITTSITTTVLYTPSIPPESEARPLAFLPNHALLFALSRPPQTPLRTTTMQTTSITPSKPSDWSPSHWLPSILPLTRTSTAHKLSRSVGSLSPVRLLSPPLTSRDRSKSTTSLFPLLHTAEIEYRGGGEGGFGLQRTRSSPGEGWTRPRLEDLEVLGVGGARSLWMMWADGVAMGHGAGVGGLLD